MLSSHFQKNCQKIRGVSILNLRLKIPQFSETTLIIHIKIVWVVCDNFKIPDIVGHSNMLRMCASEKGPIHERVLTLKAAEMALMKVMLWKTGQK